jgi:hypothetical protein
MMRRQFFLFFITFTFLSSSLFAQDEEKEKGALENVTTELRDLLNLSLNNGKLTLNRAHWKTVVTPKTYEKELQKYIKRYLAQGYKQKQAEQWAKRRIQSMKRSEVETLAQRVITKAGTYGRSLQRSATTFRVSFRSVNLSGEFRGEMDRFEARVAEESGPERSLSFSQRDDKIRVSLSDGPGDLFLMIVQSEKRFKVIHIDGNKTPKSLQARSFLSFYKKHHKYVENTLLPILKSVGFGVPFTPYNREVRMVVLSSLKAMSEEEQQRVTAMLDELENDDYESREKAQAKLAGLVLRYRSFYEKYLKSGVLGPEGKMRLRQILAADKALKIRVERIIKEFQLLSDCPYLVTLLEMSDKEDQEIVAAALKKLTGKDHGSNIAEWRKWIATLPKKEARKNPPKTVKSAPKHALAPKKDKQ